MRILPRDAMHKRGFCWRLASVCLSDTLVDCIETAEYIVRFLSRPGAAVILIVFPDAERRYFNSKGNPFSKIQGGGKMAIFDRNRSLSRKGYEIGPW